MTAGLELYGEPELKSWSKWATSVNWALPARLVFYLYWLYRAKYVLLSSWSLGVWMWDQWGLLPFVFGLGDLLVLALPYLAYWYGMMPYIIYAYGLEKRLGAVSLALINIGAFVAAEIGWGMVSALLRWLTS